MRTSTKITAIVGGVALTVAGAGIAYAAWTAGGSTTVTGTAGSNTNSFSVAQTTGDTGSLAGLRPGSSTVIAYTVTNLTHVAQNVASAGSTLTVTPATAVLPAGCSTTDFTVTDALTTGAVAADGSRSLGTVTVLMKSTAGDGCQGAGLSLKVDAA